MPNGSRRVRSLTAWATAVALGVPVIALVLAGGDRGEAVYVMAFAVLVGIGGAQVWRSPHRRMVGPVAAALTLMMVGDATWWLHGLALGGEPSLSPADVFWIGSHVMLAVALLRMAPGSYRRRTDPDGLVDVAVVFMVLMLFQWELSLVGVLGDHSASELERFVSFLYPTFGAAVLAVLVRSAFARRIRGAGLWLFGAGVVVWMGADTAWSLIGDDRATPAVLNLTPAVLNLLWLVGAVCFVAAIPRIARSAATSRPDIGTSHLARVMVALVPLVVPGTIAISQDIRGGRTNAVIIHIVTLVLLALAFTRVLRVLHAERDAREMVRAQERYAYTVAMHSSDAVALLDPEGLVVRDSPKLAELLGYPGVDPRGYEAFAWIVPDDRAEAQVVFDRCRAEPGTVFTTEFRVSDAVGAIRWFNARLVDNSDDPDVGGVIVTLHDITERKEIEQTVAHLAFHDGLTGLPNRDLFNDRTEHALHRAIRSGRGIAVLFLDLDGFKKVNDGFGHDAGDELLRQIADRLRSAVRDADTVARTGGDEFAVLIENNADPVAEAELVAARILEALAPPVALSAAQVSVGASIGIAVGDVGSTVSSLLQDADVAMYRAKTGGKNRWVVHDPGMRAVVVERLQLESDLPAAIRRRELALEYLPVVELATGRLVGLESLVRWRHPTLGVIPPDRFLRISEETGHIVELGRWVLQEACSSAVHWGQRYPEHAGLIVGVNVSARQLVATDLVDDIVEVLAATGLAPERLVLEVNETALVHDADLVAARLHELRSLGIALVLDDFGTGNSSLSHLRQFPMETVKIDRSFVDMIDEGDDIPAILRGLIDLGRTLGLETAAEGIEHQYQLDLLRANGCDLGQGYLFSTPLATLDVDLLLVRASTVGLLTPTTPAT